MFIDIYAESRAIAVRLSDDIRDLLLGETDYRASRYLPLYDFSTTPETAVTDELCEMRLVEAHWPTSPGTQEWKQAWRIVNYTAAWQFNGAALDAPAP